jgi:hypothetical protein
VNCTRDARRNSHSSTLDRGGDLGDNARRINRRV